MSLFYIFIFPGFLFLFLLSTLIEYYDRKLYARLQNRVGPPWYQPIADMIKLFSKQEIIPEDADALIFKLLPIVAFAGTLTAILYIPIWGVSSVYPFEGDVIVVIYLLTIPTLTFFLAGWNSGSLYSLVGAVRSLTQLFSYEVPLYMSILGPALLADSWSLKDIMIFYSNHYGYFLFNIAGFVIGLIALQGKLERVPFDAPEAETEIVGGTFTEYSGRLLGFYKATINIEMIVGASLLASVFLPFGYNYGVVIGFIIYLFKILFIITLLTFVRTLFARLRIEQMILFCWKYLATAALLQILFILILKSVIL